jgi:hypothetical protein
MRILKVLIFPVSGILLTFGCGAAFAQNSFPTPGGATVPGSVQMCIVSGKAVPCSVTAAASTEVYDRLLADIEVLKAEVLRLRACAASGTPC